MTLYTVVTMLFRSASSKNVNMFLMVYIDYFSYELTLPIVINVNKCKCSGFYSQACLIEKEVDEN